MFEFLGKEPREPANMSSSPNEGRSIIEDRRLAPATREATPEPPPLKPPEALVLELYNTARRIPLQSVRIGSVLLQFTNSQTQ